MSDEGLSQEPAPDDMDPAPSRVGGLPLPAILTILVVVGALALTAIVFVARDRLRTTVASDGQDTAGSSLGLTPHGFVHPSSATTTAEPVAEIAATLMTRAFSFTPSGFDAEVAAAKKSMNASMQQRYSLQLQQQNTRALVTGGMSVTTSVVHYKGDPKAYAYLGVVSLTQTSGEFLMLFQRSTTIRGSKQAQVSPFMLDVTVVKIGSTWVLSDVQGI
ncbi:MAG: hypothetical protein ACTHOG_14325 [Marmoricola sp.]